MTAVTRPAPDIILKACCAAVYESDWAKMLLGDSFHPGGLTLTERVGALLNLRPEQRVLDVAAGKGTSAVFLARRFGCQVVGVDYSRDLVTEATALAAEAGLSGQVRFEPADAEQLPFPEGSFDAVICECAFCSFPDKETAVTEFDRVLKKGGQVGLSDLTRSGSLPSELNALLSWVACIADARPVGEYATYLEDVGLSITKIEPHDAALREKVMDVRAKLLGAELLVKLKKIDLPGADFGQAKKIARSAIQAVQDGKLGYAIIIGKK